MNKIIFDDSAALEFHLSQISEQRRVVSALLFAIEETQGTKDQTYMNTLALPAATLIMEGMGKTISDLTHQLERARS